MVEKLDKIWIDGSLVPWDEANVHILTHTLHYGLGVFEGIRCYRQESGGGAIFRLADHIDRLFESAHIILLPMPWTREQLTDACLETLRANRVDECYVRPLAFVGEGAMGLGALQNPTRVAVIPWRWGAYLGDHGLKDGVRAKVSSFARPGINMLMAKGKVVGHYVNSMLAKREALLAGYDEAILLDGQGLVSEASGENVFVVRKGRVFTPPLGSAILGGITRDTIITLLGEMGMRVEERPIARDELYTADEVFLCGTAAEVTPLREVDNRAIGSSSPGRVTSEVQTRYFKAVRGADKNHAEWLTPV